MNEFSENTDIVVLPIGKILIVRNKKQKQFYKLNKDSVCEELTKEELKYLDEIFNPPKSPIIYQETAWGIASENPIFNFDGNDDFQAIIEEIDSIIPEGARENFHRNLATLQIEFMQNEKTDEKSYTAGHYSACENKIRISKKFFSVLSYGIAHGDISARGDLINVFAHEFLHMASSKYDKEKGIIYTGFDVFEDSGASIDSNRGLTEGVTEMLAEDIVHRILGDYTYKDTYSGYKKEISIAKQMRMLLGVDLKKEYFMANGASVIKDKAKEYMWSEENVDYFFDRVEDEYNLSGQEGFFEYSSTMYSKTQEFLMDVFEDKIRKNIEEGTINTREHLETYMDIYKEKVFLYPEAMGDSEYNITKKFEKMQQRNMQTFALKYPEQRQGIILTSPCGGEMESLEDGTYYSPWEDVIYVISDEGKLVKKDEMNNETAVDSKEGISFKEEATREETSHPAETDVACGAKEAVIQETEIGDFSKENTLQSSKVNDGSQKGIVQISKETPVSKDEVTQATANVKSSDVDKVVVEIRETVQKEQAPQEQVKSQSNEQKAEPEL